LPPAMPVCAFGIANAAVSTASRVPRFHRALLPLWSQYPPDCSTGFGASNGQRRLGLAPDSRIFKAWTDAPNDGFYNAEGRIPGVRGYALVCWRLAIGAWGKTAHTADTEVSIEQLKAVHGKTHPAETGKKA